MDNEQIAKTLEQLADLMEFQGVNPFRLKAYRNGARAVRELPRSISSMVDADDDLTKLDGIGKSVAAKCRELCETGKLQQLEEILTQVPRSVLEFLNIPKLGPKKAAVLFNELELTTLDELKAACEAGKVQELPGFAAKQNRPFLKVSQSQRPLHGVCSGGTQIYWLAACEITFQAVKRSGKSNSLAATAAVKKLWATSISW